MRVFRFSIALWVLVFGGISGSFADTYDIASGQLTIDKVRVWDTYYTDVVVAGGNVIRIVPDSPQGTIDVFDPVTNRLTIPSVSAGGMDYTNVVATVDPASVLSVGGQTPVTALSEAETGWIFTYEDYLSANRSYSYAITSGPNHPVRFGTTSERFEVRKGDCGGNDCTRPDGVHERSEVAQIAIQNYEGDEYWYGWSFYVPADFTDATSFNKFLILGQFQQSPSYKPAFLFVKQSGGDFQGLSANVGSPQLWQLVTDANFRGRWHDVVVHAKWSATSGGFFKVWINGELKVDRVGPNRSPNDDFVYAKHGVYRPADIPEDVHTVIYFDEVRRGTRREDVDILILEQKY